MKAKFIRRSIAIFALAMVSMTVSPAAARAQDAVVLGGGGAKGLAHVGVLLGLEQRGHDPDIVTGTSMGAVVGALYAAGYSPEEIRRRILEVQWGTLFAPTPVVIGPERSLRQPMLMVDIEFTRFRASRGVLGQWRINRELALLLFEANARSRGDFDRLPRRFRAVTTDLKSGDAVVLSSGDLARAVRASMAVPGFFAPIEWDGKHLIDGGIVDNVPTALARSMGASYIIASSVSRPADEILSFAPLSVVGRALDLMELHAQRDPIPPDVLILPKLDPSVTAASFPNDATPLVANGLEAALAVLPQRTVSTVPRSALPPAPDSLAGVLIEAPDSALMRFARRVFKRVAPGPYDPARIQDAIDVLYTTGLFEAVWPGVRDSVSAEGGASWLTLRLEGPPPLSLSAAAGYDSDRGGRAWAAVDRFTSLFRRPTVLTAAAAVNGLDRWAAASARVHSLAFPTLAWSVGGHVQERDVRSFDEDVIRTAEVLRAGGWFAIEFPQILRERTAIISARGEWVDEENGRAGTSIGPLVRYGDVDVESRIVGEPLLLEGEIRWGDIEYARFTAGGSRTWQMRALRLATVLDLRAVTRASPLDVMPSLGDHHFIPGLRWGEQRARSRIATGVDAAYPIGNAFVRARVRSGSATTGPGEWQRARWVTGGELGVVLQSPVGSIEAGYGLATRGDGRFDVNIGRKF